MLPSSRQLRRSTRLPPYFSQSRSCRKNSINCSYLECVLPWLPFCFSLHERSHDSGVVMAIRTGPSVMGYSLTVSKIVHEPHFCLRRSSLGGCWIHAFAAIAVSRYLHFRVFNDESRLGSA